MKKPAISVVVSVIIFCILAAPVALGAKEKKAAKKQEAVQQKQAQQPGALDVAAQEKQILLANINNINNQQLRIMVIQQLLNEQINQLRNLEAVFCDQYKLDVEKFRKAGYRYDEKQGKVVEVK